MNRRFRTCEDCLQEKKMKQMLKMPTGNWICSRCYKHVSSLKEIKKAEVQARRQMAVTRHEGKFLWGKYEKSNMSDREKLERLHLLRRTVKINKAPRKKEAPDFKKEFTKMTKR